jgi:DNA polymerase-3 subunit alpha
MTKFVHLRAQSSYSLLEGMIRVEELVSLAKSMYMPAICLADRGNLFGALEFAIKASQEGIQPIHGCTLKIQYLDEHKNLNFGECTFIAKNDEGYNNLLHLASLIHTKDEEVIRECLALEEVTNHKSGLIVLSGYTQGIVGKLLLQGQQAHAKFYTKRFLEIFGNNFYYEITRHRLKKEQSIERIYLKIALEMGIPVVATNNVLFHDKKMQDTHDTFLCIANASHKNDSERHRVSPECYFKSPQEMIALFSDLPCALENSILIAKRCSAIAKTHAPMWPAAVERGSEEESLRLKAKKGLEKRLEKKFLIEQTNATEQKTIKNEYYARLDYELNLICKMNFEGYFLIVSDFVQWSRENDIAVGPGRGSGAGSIVAWSLLITDLDPIFFGLIFERFLNPDRISMPDFDIDFCQLKREKVIEYVRNRYGNNRVAHIITFGSLQAKAAIKDVGRVLGLRFDIANTITNFIPFNAIKPTSIAEAIEQVHQLKALKEGQQIQEIPVGEYEDAEEIKDLISKTLNTALILEGLPRHVSVHAAGVVISRQDLVKVVPLYKPTQDNIMVVQYSMKYAELAGLVKFDFLGLQTLTMISECCYLINNSGRQIDIENIPLNDKKTYELFCSGKVHGVFQFESVGMRENLQRILPDSIEDLMALTSLYRPGPMENIPTYIACKFGHKKPQYLHPILEPILSSTYGVIIYQEQVIEIAKTLAGYSLAQADLLRRAMGKKIASEMRKQEEIFILGAENKGIEESIASDIFHLVAKFAGYGFNKSHAAAYSIISYRTAYLKAHYTIEFFVAFLNLELQDLHKVNALVMESKDFGIILKNPCINQSSALFSVENSSTMSFGLGAIKNVSVTIAKEIVSIRKNDGAFVDVFDFIKRTSSLLINKKMLEGLIVAGCFDSIYPNRAQLFCNVEKLISYGSLVAQENSSDQISLFVPENTQIALEKREMWSQKETLYKEFESTGLFFTGHPLKIMEDFFDQQGIQNTRSVMDLSDGSYVVKIAGVIQKKDVRTSARGMFMSFVFSDHYGNFEASVFNEQVMEESNVSLMPKSEVILECSLLKQGRNLRFTIESVQLLQDFMQSNPYEMRVFIANDNDFDSCVNLLKNKNAEKGNVKVSLLLKTHYTFGASIKLPQMFNLSPCEFEQLQSFNFKENMSN